MVYNGTPVNEKCTNTKGDVTQIGESAFATWWDNKKYFGYMMGTDDNPYQNINDSSIKTYVDDWYKKNIKDKGFDSFIDVNSIYCGDRTENINGDDVYYGGYHRLKNKEVSLLCPSDDSYGKNGGNKKLKYPVGLLSIDDIILSGINFTSQSNNDSFLYTDKEYWLISPGYWSSLGAASVIIFNTREKPSIFDPSQDGGVRPALTISNSVLLKSGDGSQNNPYVI